MNLTPQQIAQFAEDCVNNHLTKDQSKFYLQKINVTPDEIEGSDNLKAYYVVLIHIFGLGFRLSSNLNGLYSFTETLKNSKR